MELEEFRKFFNDTMKREAPWVNVSYINDNRCILTRMGKVILDISINNIGGIFFNHYDWIADHACISVLAEGDNLSFDRDNGAIDLKRNSLVIVSIQI